MNFKEMSEAIHKNNVEKGFWPRLNVDEVMIKLALIHSEVSEAVEALRDAGSLEEAVKFKTQTTKDGHQKPECMATELSDICIRTFDLAYALGLDLEELIEIKHQYNLTRPHKHGKSF